MAPLPQQLAARVNRTLPCSHSHEEAKQVTAHTHDDLSHVKSDVEDDDEDEVFGDDAALDGELPVELARVIAERSLAQKRHVHVAAPRVAA